MTAEKKLTAGESQNSPGQSEIFVDAPGQTNSRVQHSQGDGTERNHRKMS